MKYSSANGLFFVHIPKCAGLSIYRGLEPIAAFPLDAFAADLGLPAPDAQALITPFGFEHPTLGKLHQAHLPLQTLRDHFPRCLDLLRGSPTSFAVLRDPRQRFFSALMQHLREFGGVGAVSITEDMLRRHAGPICEKLARDPEVFDLHHIHFARQTAFLDLDGDRLVTRLFAIEDMAALETWLVETYNTPRFLEQSRNRSRQPRGGLRHVQPVIKAVAYLLLPRPLRQKLHPLWVNSPLYRKASEGYDQMDLGAETEAFIQSHYAQDAALHAATRTAGAKV
jgi:hypothetical protein